MNIVGAIERRVEPGWPAVWMGGREWSYGELLGRVGELAARLRRWPAWQAAPVPRIGVLGDNGIDYLVVALAVLRAGGCFVPLAGELTPPERDQLAGTTALHGVLVLGGHDWPGGTEVLEPRWSLRGRLLHPGRPRFSGGGVRGPRAGVHPLQLGHHRRQQGGGVVAPVAGGAG